MLLHCKFISPLGDGSLCVNHASVHWGLQFKRHPFRAIDVSKGDIISNSKLFGYNLEFLYQNKEGWLYLNEYSMHILGTHFRNATGYVEGNDDYMLVEESGNMILITYAYYRFSWDTGFVQQHYAKIQRFAQYLVDSG